MINDHNFMKRQISLLLGAIIFLFSGTLCAQNNTLSIIPEPASVKLERGHFSLATQLSIVSKFPEAISELTHLQDLILQKTGFEL